jgi:hypothetical protein
MGLEHEIKRFLDQQRAGIPWILRVDIGEISREALHEVSDVEFMHGLQIQISALNEAVLRLARAVDERHGL